MMKALLIGYLFAIFVIVAGCLSCNAPPPKIPAPATEAAGWKYLMHKGQELRYKSVANVETALSRGGKDITINTVANGVIHAVVEDVSADKFTYTTTFDDLSVSITGAADAGMKDTTARIGEIIGKRLRRVASVFGREQSLAVVDTPHFSNMLMQQLSLGSKNMDLILVELPEHPVSIGGTWEIARNDTQAVEENKLISGTTLVFTYQRDADTLGHHVAVIGFTVKNAMGGKTKIQHMYDAEISGEGGGKGTAYFDLTTGLVVSKLMTMEMNQQATITQPQNIVMSQTMTMVSEMTLMQ